MMAALEEEGSASTGGESPTKLTAAIGIVADEVFTNGNENETTDSNFLHAGYLSAGEPILPRKSSLIKDSTRGSRRKKTVSFSSMPGERTIVNGELTRVLVDVMLMVRCFMRTTSIAFNDSVDYR